MLSSDPSDGNVGCFLIPYASNRLCVIATDGKGIKPEWEHVSVSIKNRCPNWIEMCFVKDLFWDSEDVVIQFHPPKSQYVNNHEHCLHMWRRVGKKVELPPTIFVGLKA